MLVEDQNLLREFVLRQSQDAFAQLVQKHVNLVYSAALRQVHSPQLAEEVSQSVFIDLARQATKLKPDTVVSAWLYQVTRRAAIDVVRRESRRQARERLATEMAAMNASTDWTHIEPLLDEAIDALPETDRTAVILRFFENKSLREVGATLGTSDDAAQKRVSRAVEQLREFFAKRGVAIGASAIAVTISINAVQAAPVQLAATIVGSLTAATIQTAHVLATTKTIAMTATQKFIVAAAVAAAVGTGIYHITQSNHLRAQIESLEQQNAPLIEQLQHLLAEQAAASNRLHSFTATNGLSESNTTELAKLRGEVTRLRADSQELAKLKESGASSDPLPPKMQAWLNRVQLLKQRLAQNPSASIPELQLLTDSDWMAVGEADLDSDADYRKAMSRLRERAENKFAPELKQALSQYMKGSNNQFPSDINQLQSYFDPPVDPAMLQHWQIVPSTDITSLGMGGNWMISQQGPVDDKYDSRIGIGPNGYGSTGPEGWQQSPVGSAIKTLNPALTAYKAANNGTEPTDEAQLLPYLTTPEQQAALKKLTAYKAAHATSP